MEECADAIFDCGGEWVFGRWTVCYGYDDGGKVADERRGPACVIGGSTYCEAPAVEVNDDGISLAVLDLAGVVGGNVEGQMEACGVGAVMEGGGGVVMDE